ncbi:hypothetical protein BASA81_008574 [Batrachochytrium salamandrivorans]|nr:hypothetical protein BASA81_008574 [Batrachochytrium salamandrivorans]
MERAARRRSSAAFVYHTLDGGLATAPHPPPITASQFAPQTPPFPPQFPSSSSLHEWSYVEPKVKGEDEDDDRDKVIELLNQQVLAKSKELDSLRDKHELQVGEIAQQGQARVLELQAQLQLVQTTNQQLTADLTKLHTTINNRREGEEDKLKQALDLANKQLFKLQEHAAGLREQLVAQTARADTLQDLVREAGYDELVVKVKLPNGKRASFVCNGLTGDPVLCAEAFASHHRLGVEATRVLVAFTLAEANQCTF